MNTMTISQLVSIVRGTNTTFGVTFIKKSDGSLRTMSARMGVKKGVKGVLPKGQRKAEDAANSVLTVFDMNADKGALHTFDDGKKGAFRRINLDGLQSVSLKGTRYEWDNESNQLVS